jgi:hypothetical protein
LRPIDRSSAGSFFDGRLEFARTADGIALWNLAQRHQEKLNLQTVIDAQNLEAGGPPKFVGGGRTKGQPSKTGVKVRSPTEINAELAGSAATRNRSARAK